MPLASGALLDDRYRIKRVLGEGGFGAVYLAVDERLGIPCAVKENLKTSPEAERQFRREATLLATMRHPSLPRVTHHFVLGGHQYLIMDFVEGEDLRQLLARRGRVPETDVVRWAGQICDALTYLHNHTPPVIHRDIKPANIKITPAGQAVLVDFGIAKEVIEGQKTTTGAKGGSPGFAPPEQYQLGYTDARTDVYALGATLYALLTGVNPPDSVERLIGMETLAAPEALRPDLSANVAAALSQALEVRAEDRFTSVAAFWAALTDASFTRHVPEERVEVLEEARAGLPAAAEGGTSAAGRGQARPGSPKLVRLILSGLIVAVAAIGFVYLGPDEMSRRLGDLFLPPSQTRQLIRIEISATPAVTFLVATLTPPGGSAGPVEGLLPEEAATSEPGRPPTPTSSPVAVSVGNAAVWRLYSSWQAPQADVPLALSPDGETVALVSRQGVDLFDLETGDMVKPLQGFVVNREVRKVEYLNESLLVEFDSEILRWDIETNNLMGTYAQPGSDMDLSLDGSLMAVRDRLISVVDVETKQAVHSPFGLEDIHQHFVLSPNDRYFAVTLGNGVEVWDLKSGTLTWRLAGHNEPTEGLAFTRDSRYLVSASGDAWDVAHGTPLPIFDSSTDLIALNPVGDVVAGADGTVWELASGKQIGTIPVEDPEAIGLVFTPDGRFLVRETTSGTVELWVVDTNRRAQAQGPEEAGYPPHETITNLNVQRLTLGPRIGEGSYKGFALSPDGKLLVGWDSWRAEVIRIDTGAVLATVGANEQIQDVDFLGNDFILLALARVWVEPAEYWSPGQTSPTEVVTEQHVERWQISSGRLKQRYDYGWESVAGSPDGQLLAVQGDHVQVVDAVSGRLVRELGSKGSSQGYAYGPDGLVLAVAAGPGVGLWDARTGRLIRQFGGHGLMARDPLISRDGQRLVSAGGDVWDIATGKRIAVFDCHDASLAVSPDGQLIVASDGSLWDGSTGQYLGSLHATASHLDFTSDGRRLIWQALDGGVHAYTVRPVEQHVSNSPPANASPALQTLAIDNAPRFSLLGWWGKDDLLSVRLLRDAPESLAAKLGDRQYSDIDPAPSGEALIAVSPPGVDILDVASGVVTDEYRIFLNPETIREATYLGTDLLVLKEKAGVERWDLAEQALVRRYNVTGKSLVASPDGRHFALESDGMVQVVDGESGGVLFKVRVGGGAQATSFSPDGGYLAVAEGVFTGLWSMDGRRERILRGHAARVEGLAFTPDGTTLVSASGDIWDVESGKVLAEFESRASRAAVSPSGILFATDDGALREARTGQRVRSLVDLRAPARELWFTSDGKRLVWRTENGRIYVWGARQTAAIAAQPTLSADAITLENSGQLRLASHLGRGRLLDALWSPDEKYLAVNTTQCLILYEAASLQPLRSLLDATALAFDGRDRLLIGGESPLQLIDGVTGEVERTFGSPGVLAADFSHDGRQLAVAGHVVAAGRDDGLAIIDVQDGGMRVLESGRGIFGIAQRVEFTSDGRRLVASFPGALRLWDVGSGKEIRPPITGNTRPAVISPDGQLIAYFTNRFVIDNLEVEKGGLYRTINADGTPFFATTITHPRLEPIDYTFTLDGRLLVSYRKIDKMTNTTTATLIAWDLANGTARTQVDDLITLSTLTGEFADEYLEDRDRHVPAFRLGPLGHLLCSLTQDGVIRLWAYPSAAPKASSPTDWVDQMAVSPDGRLVALPDAQGAIQLIDLGTGSVVRSFRGSWRPAQMTFASLSVLVLLQPDRRALFLDTQSGALLETQELSSVQDTRYFAWRPDGWLFAAWARSFVSDRLSVFALAPGPPLLDLGRFPRPDAVAFSPDGERLAVLRGKAVEVWNVHSQRLDLKLAGQGKAVGRLAFSPDGTRLAAATGEVWSLSDGKQMASFGGGADQVVWSPDGSLIVGSDGNLWAAASGTSAGKLEGLRGPAVHMAFTADGRWLVWQVPGGVIEVWGLTSPGE